MYNLDQMIGEELATDVSEEEEEDDDDDDGKK